MKVLTKKLAELDEEAEKMERDRQVARDQAVDWSINKKNSISIMQSKKEKGVILSLMMTIHLVLSCEFMVKFLIFINIKMNLMLHIFWE